MEKYIYLFLGLILGLAIAIYYMEKREEKINKIIEFNRKTYSTEKLDITTETIVNRIEQKLLEQKRELTEDEKNEIVIQCYKENFNV